MSLESLPTWVPNAFWCVLGIVGGGIISAFISWLGKRRELLKIEASPNVLISENTTNIQGINVTLDGKPVHTLVSTTITFTNTGNQTIEDSHFAEDDPLVLSVTGRFYKIPYDSWLNTDPNKPSAKIKALDDKTTIVSFGHLKPKQSFTVKVLHSGMLSVPGELKDGKIQDCTKQTKIAHNLNIFLACVFLWGGPTLLVPFYWVGILAENPVNQYFFLLGCELGFILILIALVAILRLLLTLIRHVKQ